jgi:thiamine biosynthesis protein ThiS
LSPGATVDDLLTALGPGRELVVVERRREPVARADLAVMMLVEGDRIELVHAVAGG